MALPETGAKRRVRAATAPVLAATAAETPKDDVCRSVANAPTMAESRTYCCRVDRRCARLAQEQPFTRESLVGGGAL